MWAGRRPFAFSGLDGVAYLDNTDANREKRQEGDIVFTAPTDRAYVKTTHAVEILIPSCAGASGWRRKLPHHRGLESLE